MKITRKKQKKNNMEKAKKYYNMENANNFTE